MGDFFRNLLDPQSWLPLVVLAFITIALIALTTSLRRYLRFIPGLRPARRRQVSRILTWVDIGVLTLFLIVYITEGVAVFEAQHNPLFLGIAAVVLGVYAVVHQYNLVISVLTFLAPRAWEQIRRRLLHAQGIQGGRKAALAQAPDFILDSQVRDDTAWREVRARRDAKSVGQQQAYVQGWLDGYAQIAGVVQGQVPARP